MNAAMKHGFVPVVSAAALILAGCVDDTVEGQRYCVDQRNTVVEDRLCDDSHHGGVGGMFFFFADSSSRNVPHGGRLQESSLVGGNAGRVPAHDSRARAAAGIPPGNGGIGKTTIVRGGLGAGSGAKAGSSGS